MNIPVIVIIAIVVLILLWFAMTYNKLVKYRVLTEEAFSTMDVYLKRRFDMIPNLVETVKGYASHEKKTFEDIVKFRNKSYESMSPEEKLEGGRMVGEAVGRFFALAENYPELKASENFKQLMGQLEQVEADIASARKYYNGTIRKYNVAVQSVPTNIVASSFGFVQKQMFETDSPEERKNVKVNFS